MKGHPVLNGARLVTIVFYTIACFACRTVDPPSTKSDLGETMVTETIGDSGGSISHGQLMLNIPEGALRSPVEIGIRKSNANIPLQFKAHSDLYEFFPTGIRFEKPVTVIFTARTLDGELTVFWSDEDGDQFIGLQTDTNGNQVSAQSSHFSKCFVGEVTNSEKTPPHCNKGTAVGDYLFEADPDLTSLAGYIRLDGSLTLSSVPTLAALECLTEIEGDLTLWDDIVLVDFKGLHNLRRIGGNFTMDAMMSLKSFTGLEKLESIGGNFELSGLSDVESLTGLNSLNRVGGALRIGILTEDMSSECCPIKDLSGLESLVSIAGELMVHEAWELESLKGLSSLSSVNGPINITDCRFLSTCEVCDLLAQVDQNEADVICYGNAPDSCWDDSLSCH